MCSEQQKKHGDPCSRGHNSQDTGRVLLIFLPSAAFCSRQQPHCKGSEVEKTQSAHTRGQRKCNHIEQYVELPRVWPSCNDRTGHSNSHTAASMKSHVPRKIFIFRQQDVNYSCQFNIWKKLCKGSKQDLLKSMTQRNNHKKYCGYRKSRNSLEPIL